MTLRVDNARSDEKCIIVALLEQAKLLTEDLPDDLFHFLIAREGESPVGVAGLEHFGSAGLLRSVAVDPSHQGKGIANHMIKSLLANAEAADLQEVYLITTTADGYFDRYGFTPINRESVPDPIQKTRQFSALCPSSAIVMKLKIIQETA